MKSAMIDIETLGKVPGAAVLSIGAVMFDSAGLGETFCAAVSLQSCIDVGLKIDADTVSWWMKQSDEARRAAFRSDAPPLQAVLLRFTDWFVAQQARYPWCHGATFDVPILDAAYAACGLQTPWKFYDVRDTRTLYDLADVKVDRSAGTHHNALDDATAQAKAAARALNILAARPQPSSRDDVTLAEAKLYRDLTCEAVTMGYQGLSEAVQALNGLQADAQKPATDWKANAECLLEEVLQLRQVIAGFTSNAAIENS